MELNHLRADFIYSMMYQMGKNKKIKRSENANPW